MFKLKPVHQEILNYLAEKKLFDTRNYWGDNSGWATIATIKSALKKESSCSVLGVLTRLEELELVEHINHLDFDCIERRYYRIRNDIRINTNYTFEKIQKENEE